MIASALNFCFGAPDNLSVAWVALNIVFGAISGLFLMFYRDINLKRSWLIAPWLSPSEQDFAISEFKVQLRRYGIERPYRRPWEYKLSALAFSVGAVILISLIVLAPFSPVGAIGQITLIVIGGISGALFEHGLWLIGQSGLVEIEENRFDLFHERESE